MKTVYALAITIALLSGCGSVALRTAPGTVDAAQAPLGAWYNPGGEFPAACMNFLPGGKLQFGTGFVYFNPSSWRVDGPRRELEITLGGQAAFPVEWAADHLARHPKSGFRFDAARRTVVYPMDQSTKSLDFGNFFYHRQASCNGA
jgi:hypothetical protein